MSQTGLAALASGLLSAVATKILAAVGGPAALATLTTLQQLRQAAVVGATGNGQTALVRGASARTGIEQAEYVRTVLCLFAAATGAVGVGHDFVSAGVREVGRIRRGASHMIPWLAVPVMLGSVGVFAGALVNTLGAIGRLAVLSVIGSAAMMLGAGPAARAFTQGHGNALVGLLIFSSALSCAAVLAALLPFRDQLAGWFRGPVRWWSAGAARSFVAMSAAMLASGLVASGTLLAIRGHIMATQGLAVTGQFDAAWGLSMNQVTLVLSSMQTYYLPELARSRSRAQRDAHISSVLTVAALTAAVAIAVIALLKPWLLTGFYSAVFRPAAGYLRWTLLGDYLKVSSWILSIPILAAADMKMFLAADLAAYGVFLAVAAVLAPLVTAASGAAVAFVAMYMAHLLLCAIYLWRKLHFVPTRERGGGVGGGVVRGGGGFGADLEAGVRVSVAIATYNRAAMVRAAVEAALGQSYAPYEIVVADDASTDGTLEMLDGLAGGDPRVRVFGRAVNSGGVDNWNAAMNATRGDLIAWCSDDDRFLPGHLEASFLYLQAHPEVGMVHSGFVDAWETPSGSAAEPRLLRSAEPVLLDRRNMFRYLTRYYDWPFHPSTLVMRRKVWDRTGPFDSAYALADTDWFVRAAERFKIALLPRYGVLNRRHAGNWSNRVGSARMQAEIFEIIERALVRRWPRGGPRLAAWRAAWRANVRLRLLLTVRARVTSGHGDAAAAAWETFAKSTGTRALGWLNHAGQGLIRRSAARALSRPQEARPALEPALIFMCAIAGLLGADDSHGAGASRAYAGDTASSRAGWKRNPVRWGHRDWSPPAGDSRLGRRWPPADDVARRALERGLQRRNLQLPGVGRGARLRIPRRNRHRGAARRDRGLGRRGGARTGGRDVCIGSLGPPGEGAYARSRPLG